jgi:hypothetical protein
MIFPESANPARRYANQPPSTPLTGGRSGLHLLKIHDRPVTPTSRGTP